MGLVEIRVSKSQLLDTFRSFLSSRLREPARGPIYIGSLFNCEDLELLGTILSFLVKKLFAYFQKVWIWPFLCPNLSLWHQFSQLLLRFRKWFEYFHKLETNRGWIGYFPRSVSQTGHEGILFATVGWILMIDFWLIDSLICCTFSHSQRVLKIIDIFLSHACISLINFLSTRPFCLRSHLLSLHATPYM